MQLPICVTTNSCLQTQRFAQDFAKTIQGGCVLLLNGDLGAGKTHFVKGLAQGLDIDDVITSPTFTLHNRYQGRLTLNHFDFYRTQDSLEVEMLGLNEYFFEPNAVCAIEWSQNVSDLLPRKCLVVQIDKLGDEQREITIFEK